jgi:hypothetical protein
MTGQVKEDVLARFGELGVIISQGEIHFRPDILRASEFSGQPEVFTYFDLQGQRHDLEIPAGALAFTYCQVPVVYHRSDSPRLALTLADGTVRSQEDLVMSGQDSAALFGRTGEIARVEVWLAPGQE